MDSMQDLVYIHSKLRENTLLYNIIQLTATHYANYLLSFKQRRKKLHLNLVAIIII